MICEYPCGQRSSALPFDITNGAQLKVFFFFRVEEFFFVSIFIEIELIRKCPCGQRNETLPFEVTNGAQVNRILSAWIQF